MASRLKKKRKRERPDTMDYQEALKDPAWENEVRWADDIMTSNRRLGLGTFKLDKVTKGEGSCFPISVVQQLTGEYFTRIRGAPPSGKKSTCWQKLSEKSYKISKYLIKYPVFTHFLSLYSQYFAKLSRI